MVDYRVALIGANILADQLGLPVPAVPTLIVAGALSAGGQLSAVAVFTAALAACVLADTAWYMAGRRYGNGVMKLLCRISLTPDSCVSDTQARFERWGGNALLVAKFIPGLSIIAPPLAGATHMRWLRFFACSVLGSSAWVGLAMLTGVLFRAQVEQLLPRLLDLGARAALLLCAALALYVTYKWYQRVRFFALLRSARISAEELYRMMDAGEGPLVLDVRSPTAVLLDPRGIPGARHVPLHDLGGHVQDLPRDREIVAYCTCPNEASAAQVAKLLMNQGFRRVRPLQGGLDAWVAAGHQVELLRRSP